MHRRSISTMAGMHVVDRYQLKQDSVCIWSIHRPSPFSKVDLILSLPDGCQWTNQISPIFYGSTLHADKQHTWRQPTGLWDSNVSYLSFGSRAQTCCRESGIFIYPGILFFHSPTCMYGLHASPMDIVISCPGSSYSCFLFLSLSLFFFFGNFSWDSIFCCYLLLLMATATFL